MGDSHEPARDRRETATGTQIAPHTILTMRAITVSGYGQMSHEARALRPTRRAKCPPLDPLAGAHPSGIENVCQRMGGISGRSSPVSESDRLTVAVASRAVAPLHGFGGLERAV